MQPFSQDSQKIYVNKRFSDVCLYLYLHYKVVLIGLKRPMHEDLPLYDIHLNPFSLHIEEKDIGIFMANNSENVRKIWRNEQISEDKIFSQEDSVNNLYTLLENQDCLPKTLIELKSKLCGHIVVKASLEIFNLLVKVLRVSSDRPLVFANEFYDRNEINGHENQVLYYRVNWDNPEELSKLSLEEADYVILFAEEDVDPTVSDSKTLKIMDYLEENFPLLNFIAEVREEQILKSRSMKETFQKYNFLKNPSFSKGKILSNSIFDELLLMACLSDDPSESETLSKILIKEMTFNSSSEIKENYEINSFKMPQEFKEKITFSQLFRNLIEKKLLPFGIFRPETDQTKPLIIIPNGTEILKENDRVLFFGRSKSLESGKKSFEEFKSSPSQNNEAESPLMPREKITNFDLLSIAKKIIQDDEFLNIQDQDIRKKFLKENNLSERNVKKLLEQNEALKSLVAEYESCLTKFIKVT